MREIFHDTMLIRKNVEAGMWHYTDAGKCCEPIPQTRPLDIGSAADAVEHSRDLGYHPEERFSLVYFDRKQLHEKAATFKEVSLLHL